jgi:oxygen-independent coproporphyrinogen-3 oxidase
MGKMTRGAGLYIHIPFCDAKCSYCDFVTFVDQHSQIDKYLEAVSNEFEFYRGTSLKTIFIGGGTPTVLSPKQINFLFSRIQSTFNTEALSEATVEANPESATRERLEVFQSRGINRISFGLQSTQNAMLRDLGRLHDVEKFVERYHLARSLGFKNINVDLMFGLPGQTLHHWNETLSVVADLEPEHISAYALKIEPGTKLGQAGLSIDGDLQADMYLSASDFFTREGYNHYEISNFSKPGFEAQHNLMYWQNSETIGVGVSSASYINGQRMKNTSRLQTYMQESLAHRRAVEDQAQLDGDERLKENLMLGLRLQKGVEMDRLDSLDIPLVRTFLDQGLAVTQKGMYSLTPKGWLLSNILFQKFV